MQIKVYIDPDGDITITTLFADLVPVAFALDHTNEQMRRCLDALPTVEAHDHLGAKESAGRAISGNCKG